MLHLFLNNPGKSFYVREITRLIDEQINSVRRELANMLEVGIIVSDSHENKLFYEVNQRYDYYVPFRAIFADGTIDAKQSNISIEEGVDMLLKDIKGLRLAVMSGILVRNSVSSVDLLLVGDISAAKVKNLVKQIEKKESRELNYSVLSYNEFYYRLSVRDKFITEILNTKHAVLVDTDNILK